MFLFSPLSLCLLLLPSSLSSGGHSWNYNLQDPAGPSHWAHHCKGSHQSPINFQSEGLTSATFPPLIFSHYDLMPAMAILRNNGHTAKLTTQPATPEVTPILSGGGLTHRYKFSQLHFHWGEKNTEGSEHRVGNTSFPMEMHLVHYKAEHSTIKEALEEGAPDSLAVLAVFFQVSDQPNLGLASLLPHMDKIRQAGTETMATTFPIYNLLEEDTSSFYRYSGSLTTPDCNEIVQWTVVHEPLSISQEQLDAFRMLMTKEDEPLVNNYRPMQVVGDRKVLEVLTVQQLEKGSHLGEENFSSKAGSVRGVMGIMVMALMAFL